MTPETPRTGPADSTSTSPATGEMPAFPPAAVPLPAHLLDLLRCPVTGGKLVAADAHTLMSEIPWKNGVFPTYSITNGIPQLVPHPVQG